MYMFVLAAITTAATFLVPETLRPRPAPASRTPCRSRAGAADVDASSSHRRAIVTGMLVRPDRTQRAGHRVEPGHRPRARPGPAQAGRAVVVHGRDAAKAERAAARRSREATGASHARHDFDVTDAGRRRRRRRPHRARARARPTSWSTTRASSAARRSPSSPTPTGTTSSPRTSRARSASRGAWPAAWSSAGSGKIINIG